ncbi:ABC transporter substrate-binding protein [soil metagenome]
MNKFILFILLICLTTVSCRKDTTSDNRIFNINIGTGIETLEPVMSNSATSIWGVSFIMEGLVAFDRNNKLQPLIAKNWEISPDAITYTFHLRDNVFFQNDDCFKDAKGKGRKVTAMDFKYCLERVNDPKSKTRGQWVFRDKIKGTKEFIDSRSGKSSEAVNDISGIKALNDSTLQIQLYNPFSPFLSLLTMTYAFVYPKEAVEMYGEKFGENPVGSGPFQFVSWGHDRSLVLEKNLTYWQKDESGQRLPYLDGINITFTQSSETEFLDFQNNKYDFHTPSSETFDVLTDESGNLKDVGSKSFKLVKQPWLQTVFFGMMQDKNLPAGKTSPFVNNKKLRQALNYGVDKEKIVKYVLKGRGVPALNGPVPPGMPGFNPSIKGYEYDKEKAKQLLKEAGYPGGKGLSLTLVCGNEEIQRSIAIAFQQQMQELGIEIKIEQLLQATLISKQEGGEFPFWRASWGADYYDAENFMALFYSKNITPAGPNRIGYSNPEIDELYTSSLKETDDAKRNELYDKMQSIVTEDAAWLTLYYNQQVYLLSDKIEGFYIDGLNIINLKYTKKR